MLIRVLFSFLLPFTAFFAVPLSVAAQITLSEIMYDLPGSDEDREWVEFKNQDVNAVDISGWRFSEGGVNHKLVSENSLVMQPGSYFIIARNRDAFLLDWPDFSGVLVGSSFSLNNNGETLALKDSSLSLITSATYENASGANGDGNSLSYENEKFIPTRPTPGLSNASYALTPVKKSENPTIKLRNQVPTPEVITSDSIERDPSSDSQRTGLPLTVSADESSGESTSLLPWIFGLVVIIGIGIGAIIIVRKPKSISGYTIIEEKP